MVGAEVRVEAGAGGDLMRAQSRGNGPRLHRLGATGCRVAGLISLVLSSFGVKYPKYSKIEAYTNYAKKRTCLDAAVLPREVRRFPPVKAGADSR
jgi:hypothetical protein